MTIAAINEKWDSIDDNPLVMINVLRELIMAKEDWATDAADFVDDEAFGKVLDLAINIINGEIPESSKVAVVCVRLEAYAVKFRIKYSSYMGFLKGTDDANMKKNMYKELYTGIDRLVDALKYLVR